MIVDEAKGRINYLSNRVFLWRKYRLIITPQKFDVLKRANNASFKNIKI